MGAGVAVDAIAAASGAWVAVASRGVVVRRTLGARASSRTSR